MLSIKNVCKLNHVYCGHSESAWGYGIETKMKITALIIAIIVSSCSVKNINLNLWTNFRYLRSGSYIIDTSSDRKIKCQEYCRGVIKSGNEYWTVLNIDRDQYLLTEEEAELFLGNSDGIYPYNGTIIFDNNKYALIYRTFVNERWMIAVGHIGKQNPDLITDCFGYENGIITIEQNNSIYDFDLNGVKVSSNQRKCYRIEELSNRMRL